MHPLACTKRDDKSRGSPLDDCSLGVRRESILCNDGIVGIDVEPSYPVWNRWAYQKMLRSVKSTPFVEPDSQKADVVATPDEIVRIAAAFTRRHLKLILLMPLIALA